MESLNDRSGRLTAHAKEFTRLLLAIGENRLELLKAEAREERECLLRSTLLASGAAAFALLAGMAFSAALVISLWNYSPVAVLLILTGLYCASGIWFYRRLISLVRDRKTFSGTFEQLEKDSLLFGSKLRADSPAPLKSLLIAESELNRIQLAREAEAFRNGIGMLSGRARSFSSMASSAAVLAAGLADFKRGRINGNNGKSPALPAVLKGAGLISALWLAYRSHRHGHGNNPADSRT